ncbi:MAG: site-specific integrase [Tidjanibacter sp.]|nr:site-specific integrase [Tidjanibacter sp.]
MTVNFYLDCRRIRNNGTAPLKLAISAGSVRFLMPTHVCIAPTQWSNGRVVRRPDKLILQEILDDTLAKVETECIRMTMNREIFDLSARQIRDRLELALKKDSISTQPTVIKLFDEFIAEKQKQSTKDVYLGTRKKIIEFSGENTRWKEIDVNYLKKFEVFLQSLGLRVNTINIQMRNLRAVYNEAIVQNLVSANDYPFKRFKLKKEVTLKRNISPAKIKMIYDYNADSPRKQYADIFMLIFFLRGINIIDLLHLTEENLTYDGYIEYRRSKTGTPYRLRVEPEAMDIINRYRGKKYLLNIMDRYSNYKDYAHRCNDNLRKLVDAEGNQISNCISTYYARHSWATIAASKNLQVSKDTIASALGHKQNTVTDIYIEYDQTIIDDANRRVMDYVLYGKY